MLTITLFDPQIPPNTGNIARLCGANNIKLDLVGDLGFDINDRYLKRAGLDYWEFINFEISLIQFLTIPKLIFDHL